MKTRARKEDHLLAISRRLGLWSAEVRLEPNSLLLILALLVTLSPSLVFSSTYCIFLCHLQTIHACPVSLLLPRCLFLPVQDFFTSVVLLVPAQGSKRKINWMLPRNAVVSFSDFPDVQGSQGDGTDCGTALRKLKFHLGLTWFSAVAQQHDPIFFTQGMGGHEEDWMIVLGSLFWSKQIRLGSLCSKQEAVHE